MLRPPPVHRPHFQPYDRAAIFTGSTTMVNGKPVIVYPGLCFKDEWKNCQTGTLFAVAVPANDSVCSVSACCAGGRRLPCRLSHGLAQPAWP